MEKNLNILNINSIGELAKYDKNKLKDKFGVMGLELWNHANGIDTSKISDFKVEAKDKSYSHSQVLMKDYDGENIKLIISEMVDVITRRLRLNNMQTTIIGFGISYSKTVGGGFYHSLKLDTATDTSKDILQVCYSIFDHYYESMPIRKVSISCGGLIKKIGVQLNLFESPSDTEREIKVNEAIDEIVDKY